MPSKQQAAVRFQPAWRSGAVRATARQCTPSADGWRVVLELDRVGYRSKRKQLYFRGDGAFASPDIYEFLEVEGVGYSIPLSADRVLQENKGWERMEMDAKKTVNARRLVVIIEG